MGLLTPDFRASAWLRIYPQHNQSSSKLDNLKIAALAFGRFYLNYFYPIQLSEISNIVHLIEPADKPQFHTSNTHNNHL